MRRALNRGGGGARRPQQQPRQPPILWTENVDGIATDNSKRRWRDLDEAVRTDFARRIVNGDSVKVAVAAMPALAGFSARTLQERAKDIRAAHGVVRSAMPDCTQAMRARVLGDLLARGLRWLFGATTGAAVLREALRASKSDDRS